MGSLSDMTDISIPYAQCITSRILNTMCNKLRLHSTSSGTIPRWTPGSTLTCGIEHQSFLRAHYSIDDIEHVKGCLKEVISLLNSFNLGLRFVYVEDLLPETFTLAYANDPDSYATSFFPDAAPGRRKIVLHESSFLPLYRASIFNILCHEFGHTLGMRHWDAGWTEPNYPSICFPPDSNNKLSVMGIYKHPETLRFHPEDIEWLREFYSRKNGSMIQGCTIKDYPSRP
ncbi:uncharacterized protein GGS22DRAFT_161188 [Annulohypoxylon maeteangense]|uniref:uncharacterized protein n=1 Tax=Annulohypoxylon maeteangense TaxID=1927788 RepID=UPI002008AB24|nr:uncharacterized protein GGS22DRAFT_161188 [Annulohypoxylon maeteangense]KAI0885545.1 hypothetical protein GGS22DRAFT_161188 [Annulohypoxylon maeteangense]